MSNVRSISKNSVMPIDVLDQLNEDIQQIEEIYVLTIIDGRPTLHFAGNLAGLSYASVLMSSEVAIKVMESES